MSKAAAGQRQGFVKWFGAQSYESQEKVLGELSGIFERSKAGKIKALEAELARLTVGRVQANKVAAAATVDTQAKTAKAGGGASKNPLAGRKLPPKYRHPKNKALTWAGRGVHPTWVSEYLKSGGKLDSLLIKK